MPREWQPKVTAIKESHHLNVLSMITLFGKLKEHHLEINWFKSSEEDSEMKERNSIALNTTSSVANSSTQNEDESDEDPICWVFVLAALLLQQISMFVMLDTIFQHVLDNVLDDVSTCPFCSCVTFLHGVD